MAHTSLASLFSDIADAIRAKTGSSSTIVADNFPSAIAAISTGASATATQTVADYAYETSLSFSVAGTPQKWACILTSRGSSSGYGTFLIAALYDGSNVYTLAYANGLSTSVSVSQSYSNGTLTLSTSSASVGMWMSGSWKLLYMY